MKHMYMWKTKEAEQTNKILLHPKTQLQVDLYSERLRDGVPYQFGHAWGTSALKVYAKIRSSNYYRERDTDLHFTENATRGLFLLPMDGRSATRNFYARRHCPSHRTVVSAKARLCQCTHLPGVMFLRFERGRRFQIDRRA